MSRDELRKLIREVIAEAAEGIKLEIAAIAHYAKGSTPSPNGKSMTIVQGVLTERQLLAAAAKNLDVLRVSKSVLITPLAKDAARSKGIRLERID